VRYLTLVKVGYKNGTHVIKPVLTSPSDGTIEALSNLLKDESVSIQSLECVDNIRIADTKEELLEKLNNLPVKLLTNAEEKTYWLPEILLSLAAYTKDADILTRLIYQCFYTRL
jgi:hypothetical protein